MTLKPHTGFNDIQIPEEYLDRLVRKCIGAQIKVEAVRFHVYLCPTAPIPINATLGVGGDIFVSPGVIQIRQKQTLGPANGQLESLEARWQVWIRPYPPVTHPIARCALFDYRATFNTLGYGSNNTLITNWSSAWNRGSTEFLIKKWEKAYNIVYNQDELESLKQLITTENPTGLYRRLAPDRKAHV